MNCPNCPNCVINSICNKCDGAHTFSYKKHKEDPIIVSCMKHRNPNIPEEDFIEAFRDHWYDRGRQDGLSEALLAQVRQKEQREKGWW